jgi:hypothetical protein
MSNFSADPEKCRVDFFESTGKWYATEAIIFSHYNTQPIYAAFRLALEEHLKGTRFNGMTAICLDPHHENSHPIQMVVGEGVKSPEVLNKCVTCGKDFIVNRTTNLKGLMREFVFHNKDVTDEDNKNLCQMCKEALIVRIMSKYRKEPKC